MTAFMSAGVGRTPVSCGHGLPNAISWVVPGTTTFRICAVLVAGVVPSAPAGLAEAAPKSVLPASARVSIGIVCMASSVGWRSHAIRWQIRQSFREVALILSLEFPDFGGRRPRHEGMIYDSEGGSLDPARRELRRGVDPVAVEPQVFDLLHFLLRHRDRVVSKDDLLAAVWQGRIVSESTLSSRITAVRQAIGDSGQAQRLIRTVARKGLRFVGDVRRLKPYVAGAVRGVARREHRSRAARVARAAPGHRHAVRCRGERGSARKRAGPRGLA